MRCGRARAVILERELGAPVAEQARALRHHLRVCASCAREAAAGRQIAADLALLRGEVLFEIDVTERVLSRIAGFGLPPRDEVSQRQLAWAALAALAAGVAMIAGLREIAPDLLRAIREAAAVAQGLGGAITPLASLLAGLVSVAFGLLGSLLDSLSALAPLLSKLRPLAALAAGLAMATMTATIAYIVGRDMLRIQPAAPSGWRNRRR